MIIFYLDIVYMWKSKDNIQEFSSTMQVPEIELRLSILAVSAFTLLVLEMVLKKSWEWFFLWKIPLGLERWLRG